MTRPTLPFPVMVMMAFTLACGSSGHLLGGGGQGDDAGPDGASDVPSPGGGSGGGGGAGGADGGVACGATVCAAGLVCCTACDGSKSCGQTCTGQFCGTGGAGGMGARDAGAGVDAAVLGTPYMCDTSTCVVGQSFCYSYIPGTAGSGGGARSCMALPAACATTPTCSCVCEPSTLASGCMYNSIYCTCSEANGQINMTCLGA
jgi:hypothetical protein